MAKKKAAKKVLNLDNPVNLEQSMLDRMKKLPDVDWTAKVEDFLDPLIKQKEEESENPMIFCPDCGQIARTIEWCKPGDRYTVKIKQSCTCDAPQCDGIIFYVVRNVDSEKIPEWVLKKYRIGKHVPIKRKEYYEDDEYEDED